MGQIRASLHFSHSTRIFEIGLDAAAIFWLAGGTHFQSAKERIEGPCRSSANREVAEIAF
jgi:hypothetical protein